MVILCFLILLGPHVLVTSSPDGCLSDGTVISAQKISNSYGALSSFYTPEGSDTFGLSPSSLGDLDGDGVVDLVVGAYLDDDGGTYAGAVYILFLTTDGLTKSAQKISNSYGGLSSFYTLDSYDHFCPHF